jgi:hypothetical protein
MRSDRRGCHLRFILFMYKLICRTVGIYSARAGYGVKLLSGTSCNFNLDMCVTCKPKKKSRSR